MGFDSRTCIFVSFLVLAAGCASSQRYTPRQNLVGSMGIAEAASSLQSLWLHAEAPALSDVRFGADEIEFRCQTDSFIVKTLESSDVRTQFLHCPAPRAKVAFGEISRIVILRPDYVVALYRTDGPSILQIKLANEKEAHLLVDLLASFRAVMQDESGRAFPPLVVVYDRATGRILVNSQTN